ncbi:metallophosphoesterase [Halocatena halophila]|uniref:metallophosphoesterase n=1 Tax=Halocatena halophila TaxID=2814576 RepID=UPI002ED2B40E
MVVILSDTHGRTGHGLSGQLLADVRSSSLVIHAGDFTTRAVYDAISAEAAELLAVVGNRDRLDLQRALPDHRTISIGDARLLLVHGHSHTAQALSLFARERQADLVIVGHTHKPSIDSLGSIPVFNPGSHADPRGNKRAYGRLTVDAGTITATLCSMDGTPFDQISIDTTP